MHTLGKILWFFTTPSNLLLALALFGAVLAAATGRRVWAVFAIFFMLILGGVGLSPMPNWVMLPLEDRFPDWRAGPRVTPDGIIILGGAADAQVSATRVHPLELNEAGDRIFEMLALAIRYPETRIIFTGGAGEMLGPGVPEADEIARKIATFGLNPSRITFENKSRNTWENAEFTRDLVNPKPGERWLLVTSAFHMPRAVGVFRKAGFAVEAYPVDYRTSGDRDKRQPFSSLSRGLARFDIAAKEWVGLIAYFVLGRMETVFPKP
ncbi:COG1434 Uncharacterized conserved protein [Rhabdaerophilaceae bacterium]